MKNLINKTKICIVTGSRADYGILFPLIKTVSLDNDLELQIVCTGMHLSEEFGNTYREIESDGFYIDEKIYCLSQSDQVTGLEISKSTGNALIGFSDAYDRLKPDLVVVLGDRWEIFAAASASLFQQIPLAHIGGGDSAISTYDNTLRHCITKMADLHFAFHDSSRERIIQLGENPQSVYTVGTPAIDNLINTSFLGRKEIEELLHVKLKNQVILVTIHPITSGLENGLDIVKAWEKSLSHDFWKDKTVIVTKANADNGGREINTELEKIVSGRPDFHLFDSLGREMYLSILKISEMVVGNSSSGIFEAPFFGIPTINIGSRQKGRIFSETVFQADPRVNSILMAIEKSKVLSSKTTSNKFGSTPNSEKILALIKTNLNNGIQKNKVFYDLSN